MSSHCPQGSIDAHAFDYRHGICLACAAALFLAVMAFPLLPSCTVGKSFQTVCLPRNQSTPPSPSTRHCFNCLVYGNMADTAEFGQEGENEKVEECFVGVTGSVSFLIGPPLSTSLKRPAKQTKASGLMQAFPILRLLSLFDPTNDSRDGGGKPSVPVNRAFKGD